MMQSFASWPLGLRFAAAAILTALVWALIFSVAG